MHALLSLAFDLLEHPWWLIVVITGTLLGIGFALIANERAKEDYMRAEIAKIRRETEYEWRRQQRPMLVHGAIKHPALRDSHPDHRFNLDADDRAFLASIEQGDGPQAA
jgi:hypothetical protein